MITLHHVPYSRSFRTLWLLEELGQDYDVVSYSIRDGSMRTPEFLQKSPAGRVPALEFGDEVWFESGAITSLLCERFADVGLAPEVNSPERAAFLQWLGFAETQASLIEALNLQMIFLRPPAKPSPVVVKLFVARLKASLQVLDDALSDQEWLLKRGFSAADTMLGFNLFSAKFYVDLSPFTAVTAYMDRIEDRPAYQRARAKDGVQDFYDKPFYPVPSEDEKGH